MMHTHDTLALYIDYIDNYRLTYHLCDLLNLTVDVSKHTIYSYKINIISTYMNMSLYKVPMT